MTSKHASSGIEKSGDNAAEPESITASSVAGEVVSRKRRKVSHACIYCRRSHMTCDLERPCTRCIKRNIGHLCHDEPREPPKKDRVKHESTNHEEDHSKARRTTSESSGTPLDQPVSRPDDGSTITSSGLPQSSVGDAGAIQRPVSVSGPQASSMIGNALNYSDWNSASNNPFRDMHAFHPTYMFNTSEVSNEYSLLNDFLTDSLMEDGVMFGSGPDIHGLFADQNLTNTLSAHNTGSTPLLADNPTLLEPSQGTADNSITRSASTFPTDKARETYYLTAADPTGTDTAEERMNKLLKAKYDAGLLKPFNYVKGYARLNQYMDKSLQPQSRLKILRQLDKFRPHFRERMQILTDIELVRVEMWFERNLMEYDRVFASMAIPACCWRRTGEIFRGNKEMAELIHVPMENLRDGKLAIHEIMVEGSLVSYWEKFGAIAFDSSQKAILTSCSLKSLNSSQKDSDMRCCFSFTIRRDPYNIPSLIIGNFLPIAIPQK